MCVSQTNYVGLVQLADGRIHLGASLHQATAHDDGPRHAVQQILNHCGFSHLRIPVHAKFHGTTPLSGHRPVVGGRRVLVLGDSCGYVEPFTGEGIAWALRSARAACSLLPDNPADSPTEFANSWGALYYQEVVRRQRWCKRFRYLLRRPTLSAACYTAARCTPWLPKLVARQLVA
jgi:flavin-dependent dehydrogenase